MLRGIEILSKRVFPFESTIYIKSFYWHECLREIMQISEYNVHDPDVVLMNNNLPCITNFQNRVFRFVPSTKCNTCIYDILVHGF